eukprot:gene10494-12412_t
MADELSDEAKNQVKLRYLEAAEKGLLDIVIELLQDKPDGVIGEEFETKEAWLNYQDPETGRTALHHACLTGKIDVAKALLEAGCDPNIDDADLNTCLHIAAKTYADDTTGDMAIEDIIGVLVDGGAMSFKNRDKKLPDAGEDAATLVQTKLEAAERSGKKEDSKRQADRKAKGMEAFGNAMVKHLTNASTCVGVQGVANTDCTNQSGFSG